MDQNLIIVDHPLVQHKLTLMREKETPTALFRQLLREISQFLAYEVTRELPTRLKQIETPLVAMDAPVMAGKKLALVSILRAGNGLLDGVLELIPSARVGFVGLYRESLGSGVVFFNFQFISLYYLYLPLEIYMKSVSYTHLTLPTKA